MKSWNLLILFVVIGALLVVSVAKADDAQRCSVKEPRLTITFIGADAESPVGGNEAQGQFGFIFTGFAEGARRYIPKMINREEDFLIMKNTVAIKPDRFLIAVVGTSFDATPLSSCDTPWEYCIGAGQARLFGISVVLERPQEPSYFAIRLRRLNVVGKVKYKPNIKEFVTDAVHISNIDYD